eukprot:COSAG02_NODE_38529_length_428_cov_0.680851_1_plen_45_part_10
MARADVRVALSVWKVAWRAVGTLRACTTLVLGVALGSTLSTASIA